MYEKVVIVLGKLIKGKNDLKTLYPELAKQWHPTLNDSTPDCISAHSNKQFAWLCDKDHIFYCSPDKRIRGNGCPYCSSRALLLGYNDLETVFPNIAREWDYAKNEGTPKDYTHRSTYKASWKCLVCGNEWAMRIRDRSDSKYQLCPKCAVIKRGQERHANELQKRGGITDPLLLKEWDYELNEKGPEEYTPKSQCEVFWICSKCGYRYKAKISNRANRKSCACCKNKVVVKGKNDLATTHPQLAAEWHPTKNGDLKPDDVTYGAGKKVWWLCPEGHEYQATLGHRSSGTNCPICNSGRQTSFAEQAVYYYVKKVFPDAISRYKDIFGKGMELDIFIPSIKLGIEYDGEAWHRGDKKEREKKKYEICQKHGIKLLRLKEKTSDDDLYTADEILSIQGNMYEHKELAKTIRFLLDKIDPESNAFTRKKPIFHSRVDINIPRDEMEIRSYMTKIKGESFAELYPEVAKEWHPTKNAGVTPTKVRPHSGIKVWWLCSVCGLEYKATVGSRTSGCGCRKCGIAKNARNRGKSVVMIDVDTREHLKVFESISEASKELSINASNISMACKGQRAKAGGYAWAYFTDKE